MRIPFLPLVRRTVQRYEMLESSDRVVVALSGGPDSLALLHTLLVLREEHGLSLVIAHLDHGLRRESKQEAGVVRGVANDLGLACYSKRVDAARFSKQKKLSLEEGAREIRHDFLEAIAEKVGASRIALGHTMNDQAETVLMRLIRGAGPRGLEGIPPVRGKFIRPLIEVKREEIVQFLERNEIFYLSDPSNRDLKFLRNRVRVRLLPLLEKEFNPRIVETLARTSQLLERKRVREGGRGPSWQNVIVTTGEGKTNKIVLDLSEILGYNKRFRREAVREAVERIRGNLRQIGFAHIENVLALLQGRVGSTADLPGAIRARRGYREVVFEKASPLVKTKPFSMELTVPGRTRCPAGVFVTSLVPASKAPRGWDRAEKRVAWFDSEMVTLPLRVRTRKEGDRFWPLGLPGPKRLKEVLIEDKVPRVERDSLPLVVDEDGILWVVERRISERTKLRRGTRKVLKVKFIPKAREK